MKALTIWQPWASLIIAGAKPYEFRGWPPPRSLVGHRIAIHAGARAIKADEVRQLLLGMTASQCSGHPRQHSGLIADIALPILRGILEGIERSKSPLGCLFPEPLSAHAPERAQPIALPLSSMLATAMLGEPTKNPVVDGYHLVADSDPLDQLNWGWPLTDIERFEPPVPARGAQGLWDWHG
jgi:hypothetical protein